jgi:hypothetical protein
VIPNPRKRSSRLSSRAIAAVELMLYGMSDLDRIAAAVGLSAEAVGQLESAEDARVRKLLREGLPEDFVYRLRTTIVRPRCGRRIYLVPCLTCRVSQSKSAKSLVRPKS